MDLDISLGARGLVSLSPFTLAGGLQIVVASYSRFSSSTGKIYATPSDFSCLATSARFTSLSVLVHMAVFLYFLCLPTCLHMNELYMLGRLYHRVNISLFLHLDSPSKLRAPVILRPNSRFGAAVMGLGVRGYVRAHRAS
ncbi:unnamed protein product [Peniophora sp. CBMAI 1063]|nr:unnamed protein product [Peniophora sp. CBMAI 1063]